MLKLCSIILFVGAAFFVAVIFVSFSDSMSFSGHVKIALLFSVGLLACLVLGVLLWNKSDKDAELATKNKSRIFMICILAVFCVLGLVVGSGGTNKPVACTHQWAEATCTTLKSCTLCGETAGKLADHKVGEWFVVSKPTCSAKGSQTGICSLCKETITEAIAKKEHTAGKWVVLTEPTSTTNGERVKYCSVCDEEIARETFELSAEEIEEHFKDECKTYSYDEVARNPSNYAYEKVKFTGKVIQVMENGNSCDLRVNVTEGSYSWSDTIYVAYTRKDSSEPRILDDDIITLYGYFAETVTYETVMGSSATIPAVAAEYIEIN